MRLTEVLVHLPADLGQHGPADTAHLVAGSFSVPVPDVDHGHGVRLGQDVDENLVAPERAVVLVYHPVHKAGDQAEVAANHIVAGRGR